MSTRPPSFLLLITDQQRRPRHWPEESGWLQSLMPGDAELARTGITFDNAFCNTAMCSPSRTTLFTSRWPAEHGVELTLTAADLRPDPRNTPAVAATMARILARREAPAPRLLRQFAKGALRIGESRGHEAELPNNLPNMARLLAARGYHVAYKGKWHLTHPSGGEGALLGGWTPADAKRLETEFGFGEWEVPDAGENAKAEHFGGGNAAEGEGWDEVYTQQAERFLADVDPEKPFCLVVSLVNPHDVLGYPASYERGGYELSEFRDLGVGLPPTVDETLHNKPAVHALMRMGMNAYLGPLRNEREQLDYVNFYAHLHRVVDEKISRIVGALGDPDDPDSLRSRTVVVRCADHGEMGLSHGGLRQKAFNVYEETINVPMVISNPVLFPRPAGSDALVSLVDVLPTMLSMAEGAGDGAAAEADLRGKDLTPILADRAVASRERAGISPVDLTSVLEHPEPAPSVQDAIHFTYDDHQAGTAMREAPGQPNRVRAVRTADAKYAVYLDPKGRADSEYEMYDLERDPDETHNLVGVGDGRPLDRTAARQHTELAERLEVAMDDARTRIGSGAATRH
ncbi:MAG: sulfatase-like hydrolase/transferase [Solirubrobacterales bacterium]|nr:sulfatase-like hydrolase/transferase [Solirubrobacterales bacterium]MCB8971513.1 sulfatase-like hydrolase/transferase [Thermoleophilales bacterium]MCO5327074.1 sulfatase-like hydrolase/transferase [Solirubrobacterales bacterium]